MNPNEFRAVIAGGVNDALLEACVHEDALPFVFDTAPDLWDEFREQISANLQVQPADIRIVGSARFGFSMRPGNNLRTFRDTSDIDIVIVNDVLFDKFWNALLSAAYPREAALQIMGGWIRKLQNSVYTGYLAPPDIRLEVQTFGIKAGAVLALRSLWFKSLHEASEIPPKGFEKLSGRLYRSWDHVKHYHRNSLLELRKSLVGAEA